MLILLTQGGARAALTLGYYMERLQRSIREISNIYSNDNFFTIVLSPFMKKQATTVPYFP